MRRRFGPLAADGADSFDPLEPDDGALAFLDIFGPLAVVAVAGAATGTTTGTPTGTKTGTAIGTALPEVAGATVCAAAIVMRARRKKRDLNIVNVLLCV